MMEAPKHNHQTHPVDGHEHRSCSCSLSLQALTLAILSLNTAQTALNTAQSALQRVSPHPDHSIVIAVGSPPRFEEVQPKEHLSYVNFSTSPPSDWDTPSTRPPTPTQEAVPSPSANWYTVTVGHNPGVFHGTAGLMENVKGILGGNPLRHSTEALAHAAYRAALEASCVQKVSITTTIIAPPE